MVADGCSGDLIEHVHHVEQKEDSGGVSLVKESLELGSGVVNDVLEASFGRDSKLSCWEQVVG